jgi:hypothetical protein
MLTTWRTSDSRRILDAFFTAARIFLAGSADWIVLANFLDAAGIVVLT